jgi:uncharacterized protein YdaU (DUF1376 family)
MARGRNFMPMYWGDYFADTQHLSLTQHGAYLLLIARYWTNGGPLRDDDDELSRTVRVSCAAWRALRPIVAPFFEIAEGWWRHKRVDAELERTERIRAERSVAGRRGVEKREQNRKQTASKPEPIGEANGMHGVAEANAMYPHPHPHPHPQEASLPSEPRKRASAWPAGMTLSDEWLAFATGEGLSIGQAATEFSKLGDWARSKGETSKDWTARWRNWIRKAVEDGRGNRPGAGGIRAHSAPTQDSDRRAISEVLGFAGDVAGPRAPAGDPGRRDPGTLDLGPGHAARAR